MKIRNSANDFHCSVCFVQGKLRRRLFLFGLSYFTGDRLFIHYWVISTFCSISLFLFRIIFTESTWSEQWIFHTIPFWLRSGILMHILMAELLWHIGAENEPSMCIPQKYKNEANIMNKIVIISFEYFILVFYFSYRAPQRFIYRFPYMGAFNKSIYIAAFHLVWLWNGHRKFRALHKLPGAGCTRFCKW